MTRPRPENGAPASNSSSREAPALLTRVRRLATRGDLSAGGILPVLLTVTLSIWLLQTAKPVLLPLTLGLLLAMLAWPAVRLVMRTGLPRTASSAAVVVLVMSAILGSLYGLSDPASEWIRRAPQMFKTVEYKLHALKRPIEQIQEATEAVKEATRVDTSTSKTAVEVEVANPGFVELMLEAAPASLVQMLVTLVALFFFLAWGDSFMQRAVGLFHDERLRERADQILLDVRETVSHHLVTITLINIGLGTVVGVMLAVLGYPNPVLWGFSVALLNFAPFVGALIALVGLALVGLVSFDTLTPVITATLGFSLLTSIEGYFITPAILGRRLSLDPLAIFLSLMVWGWLWGAMGLLMAVPLLVCLRVVWQSIDGVSSLPAQATPDEGAAEASVEATTP